MTRILLIIALLLSTMTAKAEIIKEMESTAGESKAEFILRVSTFLQSWTEKNNAEACGLIITMDGIHAVILETQKRREECHSSKSYKGWTLTGENIHSHPHRRKTKAHAFSDTDYTTPGYLVDSNVVWYQNGKGTETIIASLQ
jgi:hypothetical protein